MSDFVHPSVMEKHFLRAKLDTILEGNSILATYDYHRAELEAIQKREGLFTSLEWALIEFLYKDEQKRLKKRANQGNPDRKG